MSFRSSAENELQYFDCYRSLYDDEMVDLEVSLSLSLHVLDENLLSSKCRRAKGICLVILGALALPSSATASIVRHVSPKLKKVVFNDCHNISWADVKPILAAAEYVEILDLRRNAWVNDYVVEQLAIKFSKSLKALFLENSELTDTSLFHVGRKCLKLRHIVFDCCYKVSNLGLKELSKKLHLSNIVINHNSMCSDMGVEMLIFNSHNLKTLSLANCPTLTNRVVDALYEAEVAWGKKRNTKSLPLVSLNLSGNSNFTFEIMLMISTANPDLVSLDVADCASIDLNKALREIENLKKLESLKLGPSSKIIDADEFLQSLFFHANRLKTLHLNGVQLQDAEIAELLQECNVMEDVALVDMPFATLTIEAIVSTFPNVEKVELSGSNVVTDLAIRCLTSICVRIKELTVKFCPRLTDSAFTRCIMLKEVHLLNLSYCSPLLTGTFLSSFPLCPIKHLVLDGLQNFTADAIFRMSVINKRNVELISLRNFKNLGESEVEAFLNHFLFSRSLEVTGSHNIEQLLPSLHHMNPFLVYTLDPNFVGFRVSPITAVYQLTYCQFIQHFRRHANARIIQRLRRSFVDWRENRKSKIDAYMKIRRAKAASRICAFARMIKTRKSTRIFLYAGRKISRLGQRFVRSVMYLKWLRAKRHHTLKCRRLVFIVLKEASSRSYEQLVERAVKLNPSLARRLKRKTFQDMKEKEKMLIEKKIDNGAMVMYEIYMKFSLLNAWKSLKGESRSRKQTLVRIFLNVVDLNSHNSIRQQACYRSMEDFVLRRRLLLGWNGIVNDYRLAKKVEIMWPVACEYADRSFLHRVVGACFNALSGYRLARKYKAAMKAKGQKHFDDDEKHKVLYRFWTKRIRRQRSKSAMKVSEKQSTSFIMSIATVRLKENIRISRMQVRVRDMSRKFWVEYNRLHYFDAMKVGVRWSKEWRSLVVIAKMKFLRVIGAKVFYGWKEDMKYNQNAENYVYQKYQMRWVRKTFDGLKASFLAYKEYIASLVSNQTNPEEKTLTLQKVFKGLSIVQARVRGYQARARFIALKVSKMTSVQIMQNFIRKGIAYKEVRRRRRMYALLENKREEQELSLMRIADAETAYFIFHLNAITNIQRVFRGWKGREVGKVLVIEFHRLRSIEAVKRSEDAKEEYMLIRGELAAEALKEKNNAATEIQRVFRGKLGRRKARLRRNELKMNNYTVLVQKEYRKRLAILKLQAKKREVMNNVRYFAARKQRANYFKFFGLNKRSSTILKVISSALNACGIDPISYNYRPLELVKETFSDYYEFVKNMKREYAIWRETKGDYIKGIKARREKLQAEGYTINTYEAVKIVDPRHNFCGRTGIVARIDTSIPGQPLYEVKLDHNQQGTFVMMTTDALNMYENAQPLTRITKIPKVEGYFEYLPPPIYGLNKDDPFFDGNRVDAAWKIQLFWRQHRARKIASRIRFEVWTRSADTQRALISTFSSNNTLTHHADTFASLFRLKPSKWVHFDEIRHNLTSLRLLASSKRLTTEKDAILKEAAVAYRERVKFMEAMTVKKNKFFTIGHENFTAYRKLKMLYGLMTKGNFSLKDIRGPKGAKLLSRGISAVTGTDNYFFKQFEFSPHIRYPKLSLFQGEWSGVPFFTTLKPHGEGIAVFLDGWGYSEESKVLYLEIVRCRYLNPMDLDTSDPYCDIFCNGKNVQTSIKWKDLNPVFHEHFELDVTNESAEVNIQVKDKDIFGEDDFMGQIIFPISILKDGKVTEKTFLLKGEDVSIDEYFDRGEITIRARWAERAFEDDIALKQSQQRMSIRLQAWIRRILAKELRKRTMKEHETLIEMVHKKGTKINSLVRMRLGILELKWLRKRWRSSIKIQTRARIMIARNMLKHELRRKYAAIDIQRIVRGKLARLYTSNIAERQFKRLSNAAIIIQKWGRRLNAQIWLLLQKAEMKPELDDEGLPIKPPPVSSWIHTYGYDDDPDYRLKRNRRFVQNSFNRLLKKKMYRVFSDKFGVLLIDKCPTDLSDAEKQSGDTLCEHNQFLLAFLPAMNTKFQRKQDIVRNCKKYEHKIYVHLSTTVDLKKTVFFYVIMVQCLVRCRSAWKLKKLLIRCNEAFARLQRKFRQRSMKLHKSAFKIQSFFHFIRAKKVVSAKRIDSLSAQVIQRSFRCFCARMEIINRRCIKPTDISILRQSSLVEDHGAEKMVDFKNHTFYMSQSKSFAEIKFEFRFMEALSDIWIMTGMFFMSPHRVSIAVVSDKVLEKYTVLVDDVDLDERGNRWYKFPIQTIPSKYYKITFQDTSGEEDNLAVRQIRFIRAKERSAKILSQPVKCILNNDPGNISFQVGNKKQVELEVKADAWPPPTYQWFLNGKMIKGATKSRISFGLYCAADHQKRPFRCMKCKLVSKTVPQNVYNVQCGNCGKLFAFKEILPYTAAIKEIIEEEKLINEDLHKQEDLLDQMEKSLDLEFRSKIGSIKEIIDVSYKRIETLEERRYMLKHSLEHSNKFTNEGIYKCRVRSIRGGSLVIERWTRPTCVIVEHPEPFSLKVYPLYVPRKVKIRKKWSYYSSIYGFFNKGRVEGIVTIYYLDRSVYEGPFISDEWLDADGRVNPAARAIDHYGVYKNFDGRVFEGPNVDNHFDVNFLQDFYRVKFPNGAVYEGAYCDEEFHGHGMMTYVDGSVYEGEWHRGMRYGYGHFRAAAPHSYSYEGWFSADKKHGEGVICFKDGSTYIGEYSFDHMTGKGIYITSIRDVYRGEMKDGLYHGHGEMLYSNGSRYVGKFTNGKRHGKGVMTEKNGSEFYGHFVDDVKNGEYVVKYISPLEELGQDCYEIRIGLYNMGQLVKWVTKFSNPLLTKQFIKLFADGKEAFDGVFSMLVAKNLPKMPEGVDPFNKDVLNIMNRIRKEAGMLVGQDVLLNAQKKLVSLLEPARLKKEQFQALQKSMDALGLKILSLDQDASILKRKFEFKFMFVEREFQKIEQVWFDDKGEHRPKFQNACKAMEKLEKDVWFEFKNHRIPPPFTKKVLDAVCIILGLPREWPQQQLLLSDSVACAREKDDLGLRFDFKCKLVFMMKDFDVFHYTKERPLEAEGDLNRILSDVRFKRDSYYIVSLGVPGPLLVDWIKTANSYIARAKLMMPIRTRADHEKLLGARLKADYNQKVHLRNGFQKDAQDIKKKMDVLSKEIDEFEHAIGKAEEMKKFIGESLMMEKVRADRPDYYMILEQKIEEKRLTFEIETILEEIKSGVEDNIADDTKKAQTACRLKGVEYVEKVYVPPILKDVLYNEIYYAQQACIDYGENIGYSIAPQDNIITEDRVREIVEYVVQVIVQHLNEGLNAEASARAWVMMNGRTIRARFIYVLCYKLWKDVAVDREDQNACRAWEEIFIEPLECAKKAIIARVSTRMSKVAREQGRIWATKHPLEIEMARAVLAEEYKSSYSKQPGARAIEFLKDTTGAVAPDLRAMCLCWTQMYPEEFKLAQAEYDLQLVTTFEEKHGKDKAGLISYQILNGLEEAAPFVADAEAATKWKESNMLDFLRIENGEVDKYCAAFEQKRSTETAMEAARTLDNQLMMNYVTDPATIAEMMQQVMKEDTMPFKELCLLAKCWGQRNMGLLRAASSKLKIENHGLLVRRWGEFSEASEQFMKGSYLYTPAEIRDDPDQDRFYGFRERLKLKYHWVYCYLLRLQAQAMEELENLVADDPLFKTLHNVRPSEAKKVRRKMDREFLSTKAISEKTLADSISKISIWNSYFGAPKEDDPQESS